MARLMAFGDWNLITNEIYFSPNWKKMLGYKVDELENKPSVWEENTELNDTKKAWENLNKYLSGETDQFKVEFKMRHKKRSLGRCFIESSRS